MPAYCTSGGKAILATLSRPEVDQLHRHGLSPWPTARISDLNTLHRELQTVRRRGYGLNIEESEQGVVAIGRQLHDTTGRPIAALSVSIPSARFRRRDINRYAQAVLNAAHLAEQHVASEQRDT
jgi:IclR family transcriptional regulator, acetate operon repressor